MVWLPSIVLGRDCGGGKEKRKVPVQTDGQTGREGKWITGSMLFEQIESNGKGLNYLEKM